MTSTVKYNVEMRMRLLIQSISGRKADWKYLEGLTGVKADKWRYFNSEITKPSVEMLEALFTAFPQYAFWLATGVSDEDAGHSAPQNNLSFPGKMPRGESPRGEQDSTLAYFKECQTALVATTEAIVGFLERHQLARQEAAEIGKADLASYLAISSMWLGSIDVGNCLGEKEQHKLIQHLMSYHRAHLEQLLLRTRLYNLNVDEIIDKQRTEEEKIEREVEETLERRRTKQDSPTPRGKQSSDGN